MEIKITPELLKNVEIILKEVTPETNLVEIPESNGLKLVRMNSEEFHKKEKDLTIMFYEIHGNKDFFIVTG